MGSIVIGSGYRGITLIKELFKAGEKVSAVVDNSKEKHNFIKWQIKKEGCEVPPFYIDYMDAFNSIPYEEANKVFIITPDWTHREIFEECIKRKYHIFLEKPIATKRNDIADMINMSKDYPMDILVGFVLRFTDFYNKVSEIVKSGILGNIAFIQMNERLAPWRSSPLKKDWHASWEYTGGFLNEKCAHDIDIMVWLKEHEAKAVKVFSYGSTKFGNLPDEYPEFCSQCNRKNCFYREKEDPILNEYLSVHPEEEPIFEKLLQNKDKCFFHTNSEVFDNQSSIIVFSDGSHGNFSYNVVTGEPGRDIKIHGTKGYLSGDFDKGYIKYFIYDTEEEKEIIFNNVDKHAGGDARIVKHFLSKTENNVSDKDSLADGAMASVIAFMGDYSQYVGKMEDIPNLWERGDFVPFEEYIKKMKK